MSLKWLKMHKKRLKMRTSNARICYNNNNLVRRTYKIIQNHQINAGDSPFYNSELKNT